MNFKKPLLEEELEELLNRRDDPAAIEKIIIHNLRLVNWVAKKYYRPGKNELDDLFQQGVLGLMKAIKGYDPNKGKFSNYAVWWIKQSITRDIDDNSRIIRVPAYMNQQVKKLIEVKNKLYQELGRKPTEKEISKAANLELKEVTKIINASKQPRSLDEVIGGEDEDRTLGDIIQDETEPTIEEVVEEREIGRQLIKVVNEILSTEEKEIIYLRYGFYGKQHTLKEVGEKFNKTRERIRQQEYKAFRKLRKTRFVVELVKERYIDTLTPFYRSKDYTQPNVSNNSTYSYVEKLVILREKLRKNINI